jgi:acyl carrier protein
MKPVKSVSDAVTEVFRKVLTEEQFAGFNLGASMDEVDGWDSLNFLSIIVELENAFDIRIDGLDAANMTSVPNILEYLENH